MFYRSSKLLFFFTCLLNITMAIAQSDCPDAIIVCGNNNYSNLNATGVGVQELNINNACGSIENNSLWLKLLIKDGGTLGFILSPENDDLEVDFDFWLFGPNVDCGNLGTAIRCSTTNPLNAGLNYNIAGMNDTETDTSEGPGEDGNAFINWITAETDDVYYLIIDRPHGAANFSIEWTGTATFHEVPVFLNPDNIPLDISKCDDDGVDDGSVLFDLTQYEEMFIGEQTYVSITYHNSINDMITGENPIANPQAYANTGNPETIYLRMTNSATGCFANETFTVSINYDISPGEPQDLILCDYAENGIQIFDLWENTNVIRNYDPDGYVRYYPTQQDAIDETNPLLRFYTNTQPYTAQTIWARLEYLTGCFGYGITSFTIDIIPPLSFDYSLTVKDFTVDENSITVDMNDGNEQFEFSLNDLIYTDNNVFSNLEPGIYNVYVRSKDLCKKIDFEVPILNYPKFFTPNGDGSNEIWSVYFIKSFPNASVSIFDRYGKLVKSFLGKELGWDGTYNGINLPSTDYWFLLEFETGRKVKGHFAMVR